MRKCTAVCVPLFPGNNSGNAYGNRRVPLIPVPLRIPSHPKSIASVPFHSVGRFRATLLLRTTCMRLWCNWVASCLVAQQTKNQKPFRLVGSVPPGGDRSTPFVSKSRFFPAKTSDSFFPPKGQRNVRQFVEQDCDFKINQNFMKFMNLYYP